ncbi:TolC family protein [Bacteroides cellulosilyticus]|jgi:cobalt-zinc-cadmium efflux system outer membrane protein|uniref:TolC family protein n=1 Tax=Bacteroides cellulosilyticus TaxID=246787 RepID=UPI00321BB145
MRKLLIGLLLAAMVSPLAAQDYTAVLQEIESNSTTLKALREQAEADKLASRTGIYLDNPEVEFNYLWGDPSVMGNRTDVSVKQSFDFPSAYAYKGKIAKLESVNAELKYKSERVQLLLSAKQLCIELIYFNALSKEYEIRLQHAEAISQSYRKKLENGETNSIENNKAQMNLITVRNEKVRIDVERENILSELKRLNGGKKISFETSDFHLSPLPANFEDWYSGAEVKSPVLQYVRAQVEINEKRIKLNRALGLPKFSAGYMSEKLAGEHFQGVTVGVSVPLWANKNRIKQSKAAAQTARTVAEDTRMQFYNRLQNLFLKASGLQQSVTTYRSSLDSFNNAVLLKKALDMGEISLLDYLLEMQYYYDAVENALAAEKDFELALADLSAVEL